MTQGEFEEWLKHKRKRRLEGQTGPLERTNLFVDKVQFRTRHKSMISLRDIRAVVEEAQKEFIIYREQLDTFEGDEDDYIDYIGKVIKKWFGE